MIIFELFSVKCMSTKLNWKEKTITINHNIEYIMTTLEYYKIEGEVTQLVQIRSYHNVTRILKNLNYIG